MWTLYTSIYLEISYDITIFNSSVCIQQILCVFQYHLIKCFSWTQPSSGVPKLKLCPMSTYVKIRIKPIY
jgi:hypothetical protein